MRPIRTILLTLLLSAMSAAPVAGQSPAQPSSSSMPTPGAVPSPVTVGDGTFMVGVDLAADTYRSTGGPTCYWARLSGFGGESADIIADDSPTGPAVVTIQPSDAGFQSTACGSWTQVVAVPPSLAAGPSVLAPTQHGIDLLFGEMAMPGTLDRTLKQFAKAWNRELGGFGSEFKMPAKPRVEKGANGARTFDVEFTLENLAGSLESLSVFGGLDKKDRVRYVAVSWTQDPFDDELASGSGGVDAVIMLTSLPMAADPDMTPEGRNALMKALRFPEPGETFEGIEAQASFDGVVYTLQNAGIDLITLMARPASPTPTLKPNSDPNPEPTREQSTESFVLDACASSTYDRCEDYLPVLMEQIPGELVAICDYGDGEGDIVLIDTRREAKSACSGDGAISPSRVAKVVRLPR